MLVWLVPVSLFWILAAIWLGAVLEVKGGTGPRQVLALLVALPLYLGLWWVVSSVLGGLAGAFFGGMILTVVVTTLAMPLPLGIAYRVLGMRLARQAPGH